MMLQLSEMLGLHLHVVPVKVVLFEMPVKLGMA